MLFRSKKIAESVEYLGGMTQDKYPLVKQQSRQFGAFWGNGVGKCLARGTPVLMFDGSTKRVEDISNGDLLMGPDSKPRKVLQTVMGIDEMVKIHQSNGDDFICTADHILSLRRTNDGKKCSGKVINIRADAVEHQSKTFKHLYRAYKVGVEFKEKHVELDPYFLGLWLGDGTGCRPEITTADDEVISFLYQYAAVMKMSVSLKRLPGQKAYACYMSGGKKCAKNPIATELRKIGVFRNKHIPQDFKANSRIVRLQLLAGLLDSDGYRQKSSYEFCNTNRRLCDDVVWLARSLGLRCTIHEKKTTCQNGYKGIAWRVHIGGITDEIPCRIRRKRSVGGTSYRDVNYGFRVEKIGKGAYYGFTLDGDGLFLLGDFTVTHNSWWLVVLTGNIVWGPQNPWFDYRLFREWPFSKHIRWVVDAPELKETGELWRAINRWWPRHKFKESKDGYDYYSTFRFFDDAGNDNGFTLSIRTNDQPLRLHESDDVGCVLFNEPPVRPVYHAYPARFRHGGFRLICGTLVMESPWISEEVIDNPEAVWEMADAEENCEEHARLDTQNGLCVGHLTHESIQRRIAEYPEEEREARATGKPVHLQGSVFQVEPLVHFVQRAAIPKDLTTYLVVDPHPNRPWAIVVGGVDALDTWYVVDEWPKPHDFDGKPYHRIIADRRGVEDYAKIIKGLDDKWGVAQNIIDGKFANSPFRTLSMSTTLRDQLLMMGLWFFDGNPNVEGDGGGIRKLQQLLRYDTKRQVDFTNRPRFFIASDLENCKTGLRNLTRKKRPDGDGYREALEDKFLDFPRCMMYLVMHRAAYSPETAATPDEQAGLRFKKRLEKVGGLENADGEETSAVEVGYG